MGGRAGGGASGGMGSGSRGMSTSAQPTMKRTGFFKLGQKTPEQKAKEAAAYLEADRQGRYDAERKKALAGVYGGDYQEALKASTTWQGAVAHLEKKAQEYTKMANSWAKKSYKKTKEGVEIGAKHTEFGEFKTFTSINKGKQAKTIKTFKKYAKEALDAAEILKGRVL